ncbi:hypothetical protein QAD02_016402 [Eretmocerus hayati]|uniref:Uncharacterized protein n=1 Tax=Eretmocerus hayati TaxID=131215 RepID=A0ACC2PB31_9HYME|nr:hypothetical protein QAD02_016402 [Eretmocerus hayati]
MARDRLNSNYSQVKNYVPPCSCMAAPLQKLTLSRSSSTNMFQEPFFLHPPGTRPRDGLYINPMSSSFAPTSRPHKELPQNVGSVVVGVNSTNGTLTNVPQHHHPSNGSNKSNGSNGSNASSNGSESFYLHSPHELVYTRIAHLFDREAELLMQQPVQPTVQPVVTTTSPLRAKYLMGDLPKILKVDVHIGNGTHKQQPQQPHQNGISTSPRLEQIKDNISEHAYEQIGPKQIQQQRREGDSPSNGSPKLIPPHAKVFTDNNPDARSQKTDRRYSRSSSASESSHLSSEVHCCSSAGSTPSLSRNSSNERTSRSPRIPETLKERRNSPLNSTRAESEKETNGAINGPRQVGRLNQAERIDQMSDTVFVDESRYILDTHFLIKDLLEIKLFPLIESNNLIAFICKIIRHELWFIDVSERKR